MLMPSELRAILRSCWLMPAILIFSLGLSACGGGSADDGSGLGTSSLSTSAGSISSSSSSASLSFVSSSVSSAVASSVASSINTNGRLAISGSNIIGPDGAPVQLRGWNWGRWGLVQPTDAADNVKQGANIVRIPLRWWGYYLGTNIDSRDDLQTATAGIDAGHLAILDAAIAQASAAHLWIILFIDSDCGQNGTQDLDEINYCDPQHQYPGGHNFWTDEEARKKFINVWKFIADRYKNTPYLGMFEPLPEPNPESLSDTEIVQFYDEVMAAIRSVAPGIPFLVGPRSYQMNRVDNVFHNEWTDVVYTGNLFLHTGGTQAQNIEDLNLRLQHLLDVRQNYNRPIFVQQTGVESGDDPQLIYLNALLSLLTSEHVGYTYWSYRDTFNPNAYGVIYQDSGGGWIIKTDFLATISDFFKR